VIETLARILMTVLRHGIRLALMRGDCKGLPENPALAKVIIVLAAFCHGAVAFSGHLQPIKALGSAAGFAVFVLFMAFLVKGEERMKSGRFVPDWTLVLAASAIDIVISGLSLLAILLIDNNVIIVLSVAWAFVAITRVVQQRLTL
jgi:hypothetical protein